MMEGKLQFVREVIRYLPITPDNHCLVRLSCGHQKVVPFVHTDKVICGECNGK